MKTIDICANRKGIARLVLGAAIGLIATSAVAGEQAPQYTMTVISNEKFSHKVLKGDYEAAIEKIHAATRRGGDDFPTQTNLCVAYTKVGELDAAEAACNAAVELVREKRAKRPRSARGYDIVDAGDRADLAVALSNRGVLHAARGRIDLALADFKASLDLDAGLSAPGINLARLDTPAASY
jgi:tetratricopeptide (TPR) repeat protein